MVVVGTVVRVFNRAFVAFVEANERKAKREVARVLDRRANKFTGHQPDCRIEPVFPARR